MFLISNVFQEGGPLFMYSNLLVLIAIIFFLIKSFNNQSANETSIGLVKHLSLFALVWGFLGQLIGLIGAFDSIQMIGDVSPKLLAAGLKVALLSPTFGMVIFLIARLGLIVLAAVKKSK